eukprot:Mrub_11689.p1 GENE.Mrub_11689~~Mrub_11689.p1  ORF type:complete len:125 (+),score=13.09 Mrub_11689:30-377(+)
MLEHLRDIIAEHERIRPDLSRQEADALKWDPCLDLTFENLYKNCTYENFEYVVTELCCKDENERGRKKNDNYKADSKKIRYSPTQDLKNLKSKSDHKKFIDKIFKKTTSLKINKY